MTSLLFPPLLSESSNLLRPVTHSKGSQQLELIERWEYKLDEFWSDSFLISISNKGRYPSFQRDWFEFIFFCSVGFIVFVSWCWDPAVAVEGEWIGHAVKHLDIPVWSRRWPFQASSYSCLPLCLTSSYSWSALLSILLIYISYQEYEKQVFWGWQLDCCFVNLKYLITTCSRLMHCRDQKEPGLVHAP